MKRNYAPAVIPNLPYSRRELPGTSFPFPWLQQPSSIGWTSPTPRHGLHPLMKMWRKLDTRPLDTCCFVMSFHTARLQHTIPGFRRNRGSTGRVPTVPRQKRRPQANDPSHQRKRVHGQGFAGLSEREFQSIKSRGHVHVHGCSYVRRILLGVASDLFSTSNMYAFCRDLAIGSSFRAARVCCPAPSKQSI